MEAYCFSMDDWQRSVLRAWLSRDEHDRFSYTTCGLAVPRQNGKNAVVEARELYGALVNGEKILHTAHHSRTSKKAFRHLCEIVENRDHPELKEHVCELRRTNGEELIRFCDDFGRPTGSVEYCARTRSSARGWTVDVIVFDEAQELTDDQVEAIVPAMSAAPTQNRQMIFLGTPPGPNSPGEVFPRIRQSAVGTPDKRTCWHEWSVEEIGDVSDVSRWYESNPALGIRLTEKFCADELRTMSADGFARERLGWWSSQQEARAMPPAVWKAAAVKEPPTTGKKAFGVKFAPDGHAVSLVACRIPDGAPAYCELVDERPLSDGTGWLSGFLTKPGVAKSTASICVDGRNGAAPLMSELRAAYPKQAIVTPRTADVADATAMAVEALRRGDLTHWDDPGQEILDSSAVNSVKRGVGGGGGWAFGGDESTAMEAFCLAYWACKTTKRKPGGGSKLL